MTRQQDTIRPLGQKAYPLRKEGFTMIELLLVLTLISSFGVMTIFILRPSTVESRLCAAGESLTTFLETLSAHSGITRVPRVIHLHSGDSRITIHSLAGHPETDAWVYELPFGVTVAGICTGEKGENEDTKEITCQGSGYMEDVTIRLLLEGRLLSVQWSATEGEASWEVAA